MICSIYKITNSLNGKMYIGQTWRTLQQRFNQHYNEFRFSKISNAMVKYGKDKFNIELITICHTQEIADYLEQYFIEKFNAIEAGYNLLSGGSHGKHSEETKRKMSLARQGKKPALGMKHSEETKQKISDTLKSNPNCHRWHKGQATRTGAILSDETKMKISNSHKGKKLTEDHKKAIAESLKRRREQND